MKITVDIPTQDDWFKLTDEVMPEDGTLCVIIPLYGSRAPEIVQYRKPDWIFGGGDTDYFLCVGELFRYAAEGGDVKNDSELNPGCYMPRFVSHWKPLNLPEQIDRKLKNTIAGWFEGDEG